MSICPTCWKAWIWACPLLIEIPKNMISCSAYKPTDAYIKSKELIDGFVRKLKGIEHHKERDDRGYLTFKCEWSDIEIIINEYEKKLDE